MKDQLKAWFDWHRREIVAGVTGLVVGVVATTGIVILMNNEELSEKVDQLEDLTSEITENLSE